MAVETTAGQEWGDLAVEVDVSRGRLVDSEKVGRRQKAIGREEK
jgi:hypothetical protein